MKGVLLFPRAFAHPLSLSLFSPLFLSSTQPLNPSAVLLNVTDPTNRGTALALLTVLDDVGRGAGPFVVAQVASRFGRRATFAWSTLGWVLCGVVFAAGGLTLKRDELAMQERLRRQVLEAVDEEEGGSGGAAAAAEDDDCCRRAGGGTAQAAATPATAAAAAAPSLRS